MDDKIQILAEEHAAAFTKLTEMEGMVIRGQVMVESNLNRAIQLSLHDKEEYKPDKFSFSQILIIGHMLGVSNAFKGELNALNKLRNQVAHGIAFDEKYIDIIIQEVKKKSPDSIKPDGPKIAALGAAISFICGALAISSQSSWARILSKK